MPGMPLRKKLDQMDSAIRAKRVAGGPGVLVSESRGTVSVSVGGEVGEAEPNLMGVITTTIPARSGVSPAFVWGVGAALVLNGTKISGAQGSASAAKTITVYNMLETAIEARPKPVLLIPWNGLYFAAVGDCPT